MSHKTDVVKTPKGYSSDIEAFVIPILTLAVMRGETDSHFNDDVFYEMFDKKIQKEDDLIQLAYARRCLDEDDRNRVFNHELTYEKYVEQFELGAKAFVEEFLIINKGIIRTLLRKDVCEIKISQLVSGQWLMKTNLKESRQ